MELYVGCSPIKVVRELGSDRQNGGIPMKIGMQKPTNIGKVH
jgi:hypothetical protein